MAGQGHDAEVIVVGGGPAGSTVATLLAGRGHRVIVLDKARFPRHKPCSEYVNAGAVMLLHELGVGAEVAALGPHRMEAMRIFAPGGQHAVMDFAAVGGHALGLSRCRLDALLLERARAADVDVREGAHVRDLIRDGGRVLGVEATIDGSRQLLRAPLTIGADGRHSAVCRLLQLGSVPRWPRRTGLVAHYRGVDGLDCWGEMHVGRHGYVGIAPLEGGLTNVAVVASSQAVAGRSGSLDAFFQEFLGRFPAVAALLTGAERVGGIRGVGPMAHRPAQVVGDGWLLVGDAAGFLDPFTGDGIHEALRGASLAAPIASAALRSGDLSGVALAPYRAAHRRAFAAKRQLAWLIQGFIASPPLFGYAVARLAARPHLAATLAGALSDLAPAENALSPRFLARVLWP